MVSVQVLSDSERHKMRKKLEEYADAEADDLTKYLYEEMVGEGDVEVRFFPTPESGEAEAIHFEIVVQETADWYEELGSYSADNLRNGGPVYEALAEEVESVVGDALGTRPAFVVDKGSGAFTAEVQV